MQGTGIGTSLMLIAIGAILAFAVNFQASGLDINAVGGILMVVGVIGLLLSFVALGDFAGFGRRDVVTHDAPPTTTTTHSHEDTTPTHSGGVETVSREERVIRR
ncbi:MAG: hypothetical protein GEU75_09095 [Dehalococcoidia bacterium]|nr:hypothetical protein [Dehalococcoidia bacterium]